MQIETQIEIAPVVAIAALLTIAIMVLTVNAHRHHRDPDTLAGMRWLFVADAALLIAASAMLLEPLLPFAFSAVLIAGGTIACILSGYGALSRGVGQRPSPARLIALGLMIFAMLAAMILAGLDLHKVLAASSVMNGALVLVLAYRLRAQTREMGVAQQLLATLPFLLIAVIYAARLLAIALGADAAVLTLITLALAFFLTFALLQWVFTLIAFGTVRLTRSLRSERQKAEAANAQKSRFLANMSHEIRTPLNGILGMAQVLEQRVTDPSDAELIAMISDSGEDLLRILNDILDLSKVEAGRIDLVMQPFRPIEPLERAARIHRLRAAENGVALHLDADPRLNEPRLGDTQRVMQILNNLLGNAVKFTSEGSILLHARLVGVGDDRVVIDVQDSGIGMTEAQLARVFEDFVQADDSISRRFGGTGLGLSITRKLVVLMGGSIDAHSVPGRGTSIRVELPLPTAPRTGSGRDDLPEMPTPALAFSGAVPPDPAGLGSTSVTSRVGGAEREPALPGGESGVTAAPLRILLADDNGTNRHVVRAMLAHGGHRIETAENGRQALEHFVSASAQATQSGFDLLILDIQMPEMDGLEALRAIRAHAHSSAVPMPPAIALTANVMAEQLAAYRACGFDATLQKPLRRDALLRTVDKAALTRARADRMPDQTLADKAETDGDAVAAHGAGHDTAAAQRLASATGLGHAAGIAGSVSCPGSTSP